MIKYNLPHSNCDLNTILHGYKNKEFNEVHALLYK